MGCLYFLFQVNNEKIVFELLAISSPEKPHRIGLRSLDTTGMLVKERENT